MDRFKEITSFVGAADKGELRGRRGGGGRHPDVPARVTLFVAFRRAIYARSGHWSQAA